MTTGQVLVCDPDPGLRRALRVILHAAGYRVLTATTGKEALECVTRDRPRAVILELALPDMGGIELCRQLRARSDMAILMLTTIDDETAKVNSLRSGADDYMTKPFSQAELIARLAARLRFAPSELRFEVDGLEIDIPAHTVRVDGEYVHLTPTEFELLRALATTTGSIRYQELAASVWGPPTANPAPRLRSHIANLRAKLDRGQQPGFIRTDIGIGYRLDRRERSGRSHP
jgi:two-component system, OmpR family, KDP operon response regulator KdpE